MDANRGGIGVSATKGKSNYSQLNIRWWRKNLRTASLSRGLHLIFRNRTFSRKDTGFSRSLCFSLFYNAGVYRQTESFLREFLTSCEQRRGNQPTFIYSIMHIHKSFLQEETRRSRYWMSISMKLRIVVVEKRLTCNLFLFFFFFFFLFAQKWQRDKKEEVWICSKSILIKKKS